MSNEEFKIAIIKCKRIAVCLVSLGVHWRPFGCDKNENLVKFDCNKEELGSFFKKQIQDS